VKRPTIADVAAKAGVSRSTVSYALSNKRPISEETRLRIQQAIEELGFRPNATAKRLASREQSRNIGFVLPLVTPEMTGLEMKFISGASRAINQADYTFVLLAHSDRSPENLLRFAESGLVDGFILMEVFMQDDRVDMLRREGIPFVLIGRCADNSDLTYVDVDIYYAMQSSFSHLTATGHQSIAYLYKDDDQYGFAVRALREYHAACNRFNTPPLLQPCGLSPEEGEAAMNLLLERNPEITAVIVWSDIPTTGAVQAIQDRGRQIPDDLSIICQEHSIISNLASFVPAVIDIRADEMAAQAAEFMIDLLEGQPIDQPQILFPPRLLLGER
jgi:DNA-binding LacI/PurR family transcriptional regulator